MGVHHQSACSTCAQRLKHLGPSYSADGCATSTRACSLPLPHCRSAVDSLTVLVQASITQCWYLWGCSWHMVHLTTSQALSLPISWPTKDMRAVATREAAGLGGVGIDSTDGRQTAVGCALAMVVADVPPGYR
jgi:hypothetical protein